MSDWFIVTSSVLILAAGLTAVAAGAIGWWSKRRTQKLLTKVEAIEKAARSIADDNLHLSGELQLTRDARDDLLGRIEGIVKEANSARELYILSGAQHGAAQAMMLREIDSLARQYDSLAKEFKAATGKLPRHPHAVMNRSIQVVAADFRAEHVHEKELGRVLAEAERSLESAESPARDRPVG